MDAVKNVKSVYSEVLQVLMMKNPDIMAVDMDLMRISGADALKEPFSARQVNAGIAEQNAIAIAAGMAAMGKIVYVSGFCEFIGTRASDQILDTVCYNELNVKIMGTYAGITSALNGGTHISIQDMASLRAMPGMTIMEISDLNELEWALYESAAINGPVYIRVPKAPSTQMFSENTQYELGKGIVLSSCREPQLKSRVALITSGITTREGLLAAKILEREGISFTHVHMTSVKPLDVDLIVSLAKSHSILITADNHSIIGGLGSGVCEITAEYQPVKVLRLGVRDVFCEGMKEEELAKKHGISADEIAEMIRRHSILF